MIRFFCISILALYSRRDLFANQFQRRDLKPGLTLRGAEFAINVQIRHWLPQVEIIMDRDPVRIPREPGRRFTDLRQLAPQLQILGFLKRKPFPIGAVGQLTPAEHAKTDAGPRIVWARDHSPHLDLPLDPIAPPLKPHRGPPRTRGPGLIPTDLQPVPSLRECRMAGVTL